MNNTIEEDSLVKDRYKSYTSAQLFIYSVIEGEIQLLLFKNSSEDKYKHFFTQMLSFDNAPTFAIARLLTQFYSIFSKVNIEKLHNKQLKKKDLTIEKVEWFNLWNNETFYDWLEIISSEEVIQYDGFDDSIIYFVDLRITDTSLLNDVIAKNKLDIKFKLFSSKDLENNQTVQELTHNVLKISQYDTLIKDTLSAFQQDSLTYFFTLSNKEPNAERCDQVGFYHFPALLQGLYKRNKERWILYSTGSGVYPSEEQLSKTKALIIPGSHLSVNMKHSFLRQAESWFRQFHVKYPKVKFLGICFGIQQICTSLGGKVDSMRNRKTNRQGFISYPEKIVLEKTFWELSFVKESGVEKKDYMYLYQSHGDEVTEIPQGFKLTGSSPSCKVEVIVSDDERYFCIQGHPEYDIPFTTARFCNTSSYCDKEEMDEAFKERVKQRSTSQNNQTEWRKMCYTFLKN